MCDCESVAKSLRCCASDSEPCEHCNCELEECNPKTIMEIAADVIEELLAKDTNVHGKNVGEWISAQSNGERFFRCSRCGAFLKESFFNLGYSVNYCPNCGAAMMEVINDA